ncbi:MAG TPA: M23 family metallopeptidase [Bacteroidia bacterium]|nr:M23 family metallopeptidase [Bacteroidia bacterium]
MAEEQNTGTKSSGKRKKIYRKLRSKYRLVIMNDQTLEERTSLRLSPLNVFVFFGTVIISLVTFIIYIIAFTPLREYIPGYTDVNMRRKLVALTLKTDSLQQRLKASDFYFQNLRDIINGKAGNANPLQPDTSQARYDTIQHLNKSREDSLLRTEIESQDQYNLAVSSGAASPISSFYFFTPLKGTITADYEPKKKHFGVDIVSKPNEAIKSTLDGTVIISDWTSETGYVIGVQHSNNLFSFYKHNSALLKRAGDYVKAGEVIAIIGNSGEYTTGPHLHFELWYNGTAVNPVDYILF